MEINELQKQLNEQQKALAMIYKSVEKTRKMILWSAVATVVTFVIPLIVVIVMLPKTINILTGGIDGARFDAATSFNEESLSDTLNHLKNLGF
jgi:hypothetical protein